MKTKINKHTDDAGVVWGQKVERTGKWGKWTFSRNVGKPFKIFDPNYVPDASPRIANDDALVTGLNVGLIATLVSMGALVLVAVIN